MSQNLDRRQLIKSAAAAGAATGAVWVAPSVLGSSSAFAASSPGTCPSDVSLAFVAGKTVTPYPTGNGNGIDSNSANNNGWVVTQTRMSGTDALGVFTNYHAPPPNVPQFVVEKNPNTSYISTANVTYTHSLGPLSTATTYTFTSQIFSVDSNQYTQLLDVQILNSGGTVVATLGRYRTDSSTATNNTNYSLLSASTWGSYGWTFHPGTAGVYQIRFLFSFTAAGTGANTGSNNGVGDDIAITAPTVTCA